MKLTDLEPQFLRIESPGHYMDVDDIALADGIWFLCPKCFAANGGPVGTHRILCWSPKVPQTEPPTPGRWNLVGAGYHDLSLVAGSSSILLTHGCQWHGWVTNGEIRE